MKIPLDFTVGHCVEKDAMPATFVPASVPGNAQLDWARAADYPCHQYGKNSEMFAWMEDVYWRYTTTITCPKLENGQQFFFVSKGIDYEFDILLDGKHLLHQEGMFTPVRLNLTGHVKPGEEKRLDIVIYPAPKAAGRGRNKSEADESVKPPVSYGWDWHPRLIVSGLYEECYLEVREKVHFHQTDMTYALSDDLSVAKILLTCFVDPDEADDYEATWQLHDDNGKEVCRHTFADGCAFGDGVLFHKPELWWPNGQGAQTLYTSTFTLLYNGQQVETKRTRVGFRRCKLVPNANVRDHGFPKSANLPPITMEINGRKIFCKGSNWVEPEIFTGTITRDTYEPLVRLAKEAHFNMLRHWGGCMIPKESFFDLCDEMGLLVWQEFPLSCNNYRDVPHYLRTLNRESISIIRRVRKHPCLAMWSGGNELFNDWSGMTEQSLALRLLNANCYQQDPYTPFIPTSPLPGMGHGCYLFRFAQPYVMPQHLQEKAEPYDCHSAFLVTKKTAYTEFGCPGTTDIDTLKKIIPPDELFPPQPGGAWEHHHAFYSWHGGERESWLYSDVAAHYFGEAQTLEELVDRTNFLQSVGYKVMFEEARRQWPDASMALNWDYNEPWWCAAGNNIITYPAQPKPAYYAVQAACRPQMASARVVKFDWENGEEFVAELFILNDAPEELPPLVVTATLSAVASPSSAKGKEYPPITWHADATPAGANQASAELLRIKIDEAPGTMLRLTLAVGGRGDMGSEYSFIVKK